MTLNEVGRTKKLSDKEIEGSNSTLLHNTNNINCLKKKLI